MNRLLKSEIYLAHLNPTVGSEIAKTRPVLIVSNDINNQYDDTITILPITSSTEKIYPFEVFLPKGERNLTADSKAKANRIRTIDKLRLKKRFGRISTEKLNEIENAILIHLEIEK